MLAGASIGDAIIAIAAVLPATITSIAGLVVALRSRNENRAAHGDVIKAVQANGHAVTATAVPIAEAVGAKLPDDVMHPPEPEVAA